MERSFSVGCHVIYFDEFRNPHNALVTNWFHGGPMGQTLAAYTEQHEKRQAANSPEFRQALWMPCCNVIWVTPDKSEHDQYGHQTKHASSTPHGRSQGNVPFLGRCWCWPEELDEALALTAKAMDSAAT